MIVSNATSYMSSIHLYNRNFVSHDITKLATVKRMNHPFNCMTLDVSESKDLAEVEPFLINFKFLTTNSSFTAEIHAESKASSLDRDNPQAKKLSTGDKMQLNNMTKTGFKRYFVDFEQSVLVEKQGCQRYPTAEFLTYAACDTAFIEDRVASYPTGMVPVVTANNQKVTRGPLYVPGDTSNYAVWKLFVFQVLA